MSGEFETVKRNQGTIVASLLRQLGWTHFTVLIPIKDQLKRDFYAEMCRLEGWSTRVLREKIDGMLYERTALSKKPDELIRRELDALREEDTLTPDLVFKDPYFLDFLGLRDTYSEKDLEAALLREIERFLLELDTGFAFVERQKRIVIDGEDFYLDLLFYHRRLKRLVLVELKLGAFQAALPPGRRRIGGTGLCLPQGASRAASRKDKRLFPVVRCIPWTRGRGPRGRGGGR